MTQRPADPSPDGEFVHVYVHSEFSLLDAGAGAHRPPFHVLDTSSYEPASHAGFGKAPSPPLLVAVQHHDGDIESVAAAACNHGGHETDADTWACLSSEILSDFLRNPRNRDVALAAIVASQEAA